MTQLKQWTARLDQTSYATKFNPALPLIKSTGTVKLALDNSGTSAGVFGPMIQKGLYTFTVSKRLDMNDPSTVFAIWTYDDATKNEVDLVEVSRWGDENSPNLFRMGALKGGVTTQSVNFPCAAFNSYMMTLEANETSTHLHVRGIRADGSVVDVGWLSTDICVIGHNLRLALYVLPSGYKYSDTESRGPRSVQTLTTFQAT